MHNVIGDKFHKESYSDMMEYILASKNEPTYNTRIKNIKYKSSLEFIAVLKQYILDIEKVKINFKDIIFNNNLIISSTDLKQLFEYDYKELILKRRLAKIRERLYFLLEPLKKQRIEEIKKDLKISDNYAPNLEVIEKSISIVNSELKGIYMYINEITRFNLIDLYKGLFQKLEKYTKGINSNYKAFIFEIKKYTLENLSSNILSYEDQIPFLYLKGALGDIPNTAEIKYVIIDEAQDYTPLQYEIFHQLFKGANMTILGDLNQSINPFMNVGNYDNIENIFPKRNSCIINLSKSYRSTMEITQFARKLLNKKIEADYVERNGDKPIIQKFDNEKAMEERVVNDINNYKEKGHKSIGIITRTAKEAAMVFHCIKNKTSVKAILDEDDDFICDTLIIPAYLAKGLEFDVVIIYNAGNENYTSEEERLLFYTACTRALHVLNIYYYGTSPSLLCN
jgi:DNA helicase-2/ATP-dependent DNA helicase PcrA